LAKGFSPPGSSNIGQAEQIAMLSSGKLLQTIVVASAFAQVDDPKLSADRLRERLKRRILITEGKKSEIKEAPFYPA
jgi:hypothetical protein